MASINWLDSNTLVLDDPAGTLTVHNDSFGRVDCVAMICIGLRYMPAEQWGFYLTREQIEAMAVMITKIRKDNV